MPFELTQQDIAKLTQEQQETIARVALEEARVHRETLTSARGYPGIRFFPLFLAILASVLWVWRPASSDYPYYLCFGLAILIQFHTSGINRRIDAVLRLMEIDECDKQTSTQATGSNVTSSPPPNTLL